MSGASAEAARLASRWTDSVMNCITVTSRTSIRMVSDTTTKRKVPRDDFVDFEVLNALAVAARFVVNWESNSSQVERNGAEAEPPPADVS